MNVPLRKRYCIHSTYMYWVAEMPGNMCIKNKHKTNKKKANKKKNQEIKIQYLSIVLFIDDLKMLTRVLSLIDLQCRNVILKIIYESWMKNFYTVPLLQFSHNLKMNYEIIWTEPDRTSSLCKYRSLLTIRWA